jgi:uncharacterized protein (DUF952 family)
MNRILTVVWTAILVIALALPSIGSLIDHHFAERNPTHLHVSVSLNHTHGYGSSHAHASTASTPNDATALYNHDSGLTTAVPLMIDDAALRASERFEPSSVFNIPMLARVLRVDHVPALPDRPPQPVA